MQKKFENKLVLGLSVTLFLVFSFFTFSYAAQNATNEKTGDNELINCSQYYKFGSVDMVMKPNKQTFAPGEVIALSGSVTNQNNYPIVNGEVFVKIYRVDSQNGGNPNNGHFEIAEFSGLKNVNLGANQKKDIIFTYKLPAVLGNGDYLVHLFFDVAGKYNLAGLSFHPAMPGAMTQFKIDSTLKEPIFFDKDNIVLNGDKYNFRSPNNQQSKDNDIVIKIPLVNPTNQNALVHLKKELFVWDALSDKNKIKDEEGPLSIPARTQKTVTYTISKPVYAVYLLKITADSNQGVSVINVRPVVRDVFQPRLNFPALASFPLVKGQKAVMFSCFHDASSSMDQGKVVMTLKDGEGNIIATNTFNGDIYPNMLATAKEFVPQQDYSKVALTTELFNKDGKLIESSVQNYDCNSFNPSICGNKPTVPKTPIPVNYPSDQSFTYQTSSDLPSFYWSKVAAIVVGLLFIAAGVIFIIRHAHKKKPIKK